MPVIRQRDKILYPDLSYLVCGLCFKVHNKLGSFLGEKQYGDALENIFKANSIDYTRESELPLSFEGEQNRRNITDFIIDDKIILEIKAKNMITRDDYYQIKRYLISAKKEL
ncbi:MAG: GxxExxY protein, partial [Candidatus Nealsonbacteria bacterium]|nr:GxxExxY protein [Candidatus Nealsonbacteria bacterium]